MKFHKFKLTDLGKMQKVATKKRMMNRAEKTSPISRLAKVATAARSGADKPHSVMIMKGAILS